VCIYRSPFDQCDRGVFTEGIAVQTAIYARLKVIFEASDSFSYHPNPIYFILLSDPCCALVEVTCSSAILVTVKGKAGCIGWGYHDAAQVGISIEEEFKLGGEN